MVKAMTREKATGMEVKTRKPRRLGDRKKRAASRSRLPVTAGTSLSASRDDRRIRHCRRAYQPPKMKQAPSSIHPATLAISCLRRCRSGSRFSARRFRKIPASRFVAPGNAPADDLFNAGVYQRGGLTLHALRLEVGDAAFFEILRTYYERFAGSNATIEDFVALSEEISGADLGALFDAWLYAAELPDIPKMDLSVPEM